MEITIWSHTWVSYLIYGSHQKSEESGEKMIVPEISRRSKRLLLFPKIRKLIPGFTFGRSWVGTKGKKMLKQARTDYFVRRISVSSNILH